MGSTFSIEQTIIELTLDSSSFEKWIKLANLRLEVKDPQGAVIIFDYLGEISPKIHKKIVIADNAAAFANDIFANYADYNGSTLLLGAFFFAFQIYGDFSGYSDMAIGLGRMLGFEFLENFNPIFQKKIISQKLWT